MSASLESLIPIPSRGQPHSRRRVVREGGARMLSCAYCQIAEAVLVALRKLIGDDARNQRAGRLHPELVHRLTDQSSVLSTHRLRLRNVRVTSRLVIFLAHVSHALTQHRNSRAVI